MALRTTIISATAFIVGSFALSTTTIAGDTVLSKGSSKLKIKCNNSGCYVNNKRVGTGGRSNFEKWVWKYKRKGYK